MYFAPYIDFTGVHLPTYADRLEALVSSYQTIFGLDANLEISSPDYQLLSVFARALDDLSQLILADFASRNPQYATGAGLDLLMPLMGLTRSGATYSTVYLTLSGTPGAVLASAPQALDDAGNIWSCQAAGIRLDDSGSVTVQAVCGTPGAVTAAAGTIHRLVSPVTGLSSVVNNVAAVPGMDAESDASCRNRLRLAAAASSVSTMEALQSALRSIPNVSSCVVYENDTDETDNNGIPAHSICVVAAGGLTSSIARTIFEKKAPGIGTFGATSGAVTDSFGEKHTVRFQRASSVTVMISVELIMLEGYDHSTVEKIRSALVAYGSNLQVGQEIVVSSLYGICYGVEQSTTPTFSISQLMVTAGGTSTSGILSAAWNERFSIQSGLIQIVEKD